MNKEFMIWKSGHKHTNTYVQLNTQKQKYLVKNASQNRGQHFNKTVNF